MVSGGAGSTAVARARFAVSGPLALVENAATSTGAAFGVAPFDLFDLAWVASGGMGDSSAEGASVRA